MPWREIVVMNYCFLRIPCLCCAYCFILFCLRLLSIRGSEARPHIRRSNLLPECQPVRVSWVFHQSFRRVLSPSMWLASQKTNKGMREYDYLSSTALVIHSTTPALNSSKFSLITQCPQSQSSNSNFGKNLPISGSASSAT